MHRHLFPCPMMPLSEFLPVSFKDSLEYFTRDSAKVFIPLMRFLLQSLVSKSFLVLLEYSFLIFFHLCFLWCPLLIFPSTCNCPSLQDILFFLDLTLQFLQLFIFSHN